MHLTSLDDIHPCDWSRVKKKALVKKMLREIEKRKMAVSAIYISPAFGSVYIDIGMENDPVYGWVRTATVRIADHERTSSCHARPDLNVFNNHSFTEAVANLETLCD